VFVLNRRTERSSCRFGVPKRLEIERHGCIQRADRRVVLVIEVVGVDPALRRLAGVAVVSDRGTV